MKRKYIINPGAKKGLSETNFFALQKYFERNVGSFDFVVTNNKEDIVAYTRHALLGGYEQIVAIGGDGTIHHVVNGFFRNGCAINPNASLVVSKMGTGSDYFKTISQGHKDCDWKQLVKEHQIKEVDLGMVQLGKEWREGNPTHFFINMASTGMSGTITRDKQNIPRWAPSKLKYILPTLSNIVTYSCPNVRLQMDDEIYEGGLQSLSISKGLYAGGGMKFGAQAILDDGQFDITLIRPMSLLSMFLSLNQLYTGDFSGHKTIDKKKHRYLAISALGERKLHLELDGEYLGEHDFIVKLLPKAIKVCFPKDPSSNPKA